MLNLVYVVMSMHFAWGQAKIQVWGSLMSQQISVFNIIFESVLFIFDFILFHIISFLELFYFNCKLFMFQEQIFERLSLRAKEMIIGADSCPKYEDLIQKYLVQGFMSKNMNISYKNIMCKEFEDLVQYYDKRCAPFGPFAAFASPTSCLFYYFWPRAHGFLCNTLVIYSWGSSQC